MPRSILTAFSPPPALAAPLALALSLALGGCGGEQRPTKMVAVTKDDGVPANSASEERLASDGKPKPKATAAEDPTQPLTTPMNGDGSGAAAGGAGAGGAAGTGGAGTAAGKGGAGKGSGAAKGPTPKDPPAPVAKDPPGAKGAGGKVSRAECKQTFDRYIDLTLASDSRFEGIPPEMIAQLKEQALSQAQSQKGDPCSTQDVTRSQYTCAMAAPTTSAWQRCMK